MEIKSVFAAQNYASARPATRPVEGTAEAAVTDVVKSFTETLVSSEQTAKAAMMGGADPHTLVQALAQTELAVETAVTIRNRVVEAYQEILRMPV